ncbi:MAG TPA: ABC-F family ATP-binding cassette domain-containing protein [Candidatus Micrarchaeia archaeon]|nr:ABC-F family ATP-binding cassette domain-containing protein [Candidatus Micrarchaeia archaeon]
MSLLVLSEVGIAFGATTVLGGLDLRLEADDRLALVGANGAGKSSVLDCVAGVADPAQGTIERQRRLRVAYLPQDSPQPVADTVLAEAMASRTDLAALREEMTRLEDRLQVPGPDAEAALHRYGEVQAAYEGLGGYDLEARARAVLHGLGLAEAEQGRAPLALSVGQVRRMEMAKLLLQDADLLLLDEPTNHLDLEAIEWLEGFLIGTREALCIASHDRRFLDRVCNRVLEIEAGRTHLYEGDYTAYLRQREERRARQRKEFDSQRAHISHQEDFIRRYRAGQRAREARGRQTKLDRLERVVEPPTPERMRLQLQAAPSARVVLRTEGLVAGRGERRLVAVPELVVARGDRAAVVGANGAGKTTLLHTLAGLLPPLAGSVHLGARARLRVYRQDLGDLDGAQTVLESVLSEHPEVGPERARTALGAFLFTGDEVHQTVGSLSGGERARVALARLALDDANCLMLDEPTNHLDIPTMEVLETALQRYDGACVLVSHDRFFVDVVATAVWTVADGELRPPPVARTPVRAEGQPRARGPEPPPPPVAAGRPLPPSAPATASGAGRRRRAAAGRQSRTRLERQIDEAETAVRELEAALADPATYHDGRGAAELSRRHGGLRQELDALYAAWTDEPGGG